jgi:hypothetical protein
MSELQGQVLCGVIVADAVITTIYLERAEQQYIYLLVFGFVLLLS